LTPYYGDKTESAIGRFQKIFKTDIEYEKSISTTPGAMSYKLNPKIVDQYTRAMMNKLVLVYQDQLDQYNGAASSILTGSTTIKTGANDNKEKDSPEKTIFKYSPQGLLLKIIGGNSLVDKVYSFTPSGQLGGGTAAAITPFGGFVTSMTTCTCSFNLLLYVKDPRGPVLPLMYQPGVTVLYKMYTPTVGVNVLGQYTSGGSCLVYVGSGCSSGGTPIGTMIQLGTSAL
jgi:hypothetical protein